MKECGIYKIQNLITNKVYIGQSNWISKRIGVHKRLLRQNKHTNNHLQRAFNKYGEDNFVFVTIELCDESVLNEREKYWISYYDSFKNGYNQTIGGDGTSGYIMSNVAKKNMSINHADFKGSKNPMYGKHIRDFMSPSEYAQFLSKPKKHINKSKPKSNETIEKQKKSILQYYQTHDSPMKGKHISLKQKEILNKGHQDYVLKHGNPNSKKVICLNNFIVYKSLKEAAQFYNIQASHISSCCQHKIKSTGKDVNGNKLIWMYYDEYITKTASEIDSYIKHCLGTDVDTNAQSKSIICLTTNEIFNSISSASKKYNLDASSIVKCCKGKINYCGKIDNQKLIWQYC